MLLLPPALTEVEAPVLPPGWKGLTRVSSRVISVEGARVAKVELWTDLAALQQALGKGPSSGAEARRCLAEGRARLLAMTTYLVDIGPQRRRNRLKAFFATHWPEPGVDLSHRQSLSHYLDQASRPIAMGDVQYRALEPGWGLWFKAGPQKKWVSYKDQALAKAWAKGELGPEQDGEYARGLEEDLGVALKR
jgi:hypothetical protein